ncbi:MAG: hypothetical protein Kow0068_20560 [Marinilabiliales bacterium]
MAHGFLQYFDSNLYVRSAGTEASGKLNPNAVKVMAEIGIDISYHTSDPVDNYLDKEWDYIITVCGGANENCPAFMGKVKKRLHIGFDDPTYATGTEEFISSEYLRVRDEIKREFYNLYINEINPKLQDKSGEMVCFCKGIRRGSIENAKLQGAKTLKDIQRLTGASTGNQCKTYHPFGECCSNRVKDIIGDTTNTKCCCGCNC